MSWILWCVVGSVLLGIVHISADSFSFKAQVGNAYTIGARDDERPRQALAGRLHRAARNYTENLVLFLGTAYVAQAAHAASPWAVWGAVTWLAARALYLPAYASGLPWVRTVCWQISMIGLLMMLVPLVA